MIKVLIVDDTQFIRTSLRLMLERHDDIDIVGEADTGIKAIRLYKRLKPDVVTMDITMPNMNGIEVVREIVKTDPGAKICMVTALGQEHIVKESIFAGAKSFIVKPFNEERIINVVKKLADLKRY